MPVTSSVLKSTSRTSLVRYGSVATELLGASIARRTRCPRRVTREKPKGKIAANDERKRTGDEHRLRGNHEQKRAREHGSERRSEQASRRDHDEDALGLADVEHIPEQEPKLHHGDGGKQAGPDVERDQRASRSRKRAQLPKCKGYGAPPASVTDKSLRREKRPSSA